MIIVYRIIKEHDIFYNMAILKIRSKISCTDYIVSDSGFWYTLYGKTNINMMGWANNLPF